MRKPTFIDKTQAGCLWKRVIQRAHYLDVVRDITVAPDGGLYMLKSIARTIIKDVLADCRAADVELGRYPDGAEVLARQYLRRLCVK